VVETARTLIITFVLARVMALMGVADVKSAAQLALWLWFGFSAMMWVGAIMWEETPWKIAAIHSGDWLVKTVLIAAILGAWRRSSWRRQVPVIAPRSCVRCFSRGRQAQQYKIL
jgi:hypothetical protein